VLRLCTSPLAPWKLGKRPACTSHSDTHDARLRLGRVPLAPRHGYVSASSIVLSNECASSHCICWCACRAGRLMTLSVGRLDALDMRIHAATYALFDTLLRPGNRALVYERHL
jgi:hypothetical protein